MSQTVTRDDLFSILRDYDSAIARINEALRNSGEPIVTALPSNPYNGQIINFLADATNGIIWRLRYRAYQADGVTANPSAYKWEYVGGSSISAVPALQTSGGSTVANGAGYQAALADTSTGPDIAIPVAGIYDIELTAYLRHGAAGGVTFFSFSAPGGVAAADADSLYFMSAVSNQDIRSTKVVRKTLVAGTLSARYKATGGSSAGLFDERVIRARPVRVG